MILFIKEISKFFNFLLLKIFEKFLITKFYRNVKEINNNNYYIIDNL